MGLSRTSASTSLGRRATPTARFTALLLGALLSAGAHGDGATIAQKGSGSAAACQSCHGAAGEGVAAAGFPRLAGLGAGYLQRQLDAFADGSRANAVMTPIAKALSAKDRTAVASHYASLRFSPTQAPSAASAAPSASATAAAASNATAPVAAGGAVLATRGRWDDQLPACDQCHGAGGRGVGTDFPPLFGQSAAYLSSQLAAFKTGARPAGPLELMGVVAKKLSDADMRAVAAHYANLPATKAAR